jgi:hypothetical protein
MQPPLAVVPFQGDGLLGVADDPMGFCIGAQAGHGHGWVELAIGRGIQGADSTLGQKGLQALELGLVPKFQGEAFGLAFLAEALLPLELWAIAGEKQ